MEVALVMFKADGTRRHFPVSRERTLVGRTHTCDLRIPLPSVSREHCEILAGDGSVRVRDLGSSNGTFVNHSRIQEVELSPGDVVGVGPVEFVVVIDGQPAQVQPPVGGPSAETPAGSRPMASGGAIGGATAMSSKPKPTPRPVEPTAADAQPLDDEIDLVPVIEDEGQASTIDEDDPIAALEAMARADDDASPRTRPGKPTDRRN